MIIVIIMCTVRTAWRRKCKNESHPVQHSRAKLRTEPRRNLRLIFSPVPILTFSIKFTNKYFVGELERPASNELMRCSCLIISGYLEIFKNIQILETTSKSAWFLASVGFLDCSTLTSLTKPGCSDSKTNNCKQECVTSTDQGLTFNKFRQYFLS